MNLHQTVLAAAIMALQAAALYLISSSPSEAALVYRCGHSYQTQACDDSSKPLQRLNDERTTEQLTQALQRQESDTHWLHAYDRARKPRVSAKARHADRAVALSCDHVGRRPFESCADQTRAQSKQPRRRDDEANPKRARPFRARAITPQGVSSGLIER
jgi:hypothetical protein